MQHILLVAGSVLLSIASLCGFALARSGFSTEQIARWKVVHAGGTGGAVQLLALAALTDHFTKAPFHPGVLLLVTTATWMFFLGPLLKALDRPTWGHSVNIVGSFFAVPGYLGLPLLLV